MAAILVTGASGFVGSRLIRRLSEQHKVIALARRAPSGDALPGISEVQGDFTSVDDLARLDGYPIDAVVHLAAVTGGTTEEAGLAVNVVGTRRLLRYLVDRGVRRFVVASSIAATGCLSPEFVPRQLPIPADHPCDARDAYGLSKAMMEEVCAYLQRLDPDLAMTVLRLGVVVPEGTPSVSAEALGRIDVPFCSLATIAVQDVLGILEKAVEFGPGFRRWNAVAAWMPSPLPVRDALAATLGARSNQLDLSGYADAGPTSLYDITEVLRTTGYPRIDPGRPRS
ncbi:MAG TPA: NAD(P)-dependent oxidoreductase [Kribbella sp.]|uniref:NAD-dependent epimerase/dehydratase family protein n=1 Tax=Kribbella sp. TaxID=1871183 RepID=UPI002D78EB0C|nr:NAD(P)-dependent oxidoreductase [Kribbella sp.]HET6299295.1 NAD(P)-dependent oxidoreductase [Kribbella sp.]